jgi:hypothetical protein
VGATGRLIAVSIFHPVSRAVQGRGFRRSLASTSYLPIPDADRNEKLCSFESLESDRLSPGPWLPIYGTQMC